VLLSPADAVAWPLSTEEIRVCSWLEIDGYTGVTGRGTTTL
jgi:hypothetical protein